MYLSEILSLDLNRYWMGEYDSLPEQAFYMVGTIEEAVEKAAGME